MSYTKRTKQTGLVSIFDQNSCSDTTNKKHHHIIGLFYLYIFNKLHDIFEKTGAEKIQDTSNFLAFLSKIVIKNNQSIGIVKIYVYNFALFIKSKKQTSFYFPV